MDLLLVGLYGFGGGLLAAALFVLYLLSRIADTLDEIGDIIATR